MLSRLTSFMLPLGIAASPAYATLAPLPCEIASIKNIGELYPLLSERAIEIVRRANASGWKGDRRLQTLVSPDAEFSLGSGDVGRPMGSGIEGAHAMAGDMRADSFRYLTWSSIPMPIDACGEHKVKVEFIRTSAREFDSVDFTFRAGRLISAEGWSAWFVSGNMGNIKR